MKEYEIWKEIKFISENYRLVESTAEITDVETNLKVTSGIIPDGHNTLFESQYIKPKLWKSNSLDGRYPTGVMQIQIKSST